MYCPKCTLEIKGEDQATCPICSELLIESPVEKAEEPTAEDFKLQGLIADIDLGVSGSDDQPFTQETLDSEAEEVSGTDPDFKLEMDDKFLESEPDVIPLTLAGENTGSAPAADQSGDELSVDLEKEFSLDDEMTDGQLSSDQVEDNFYDLEKELGLVDEKMKAVEEEPPTIDFDKFDLTEEEKSFALDDAAEPDSKEVLEKTLEELDPIKDMRPSQKKSSSFGLIAVLVILVVVCGIAYTKFKPEIESLIKTDAAKSIEDEKLKESIIPESDKQAEESVEKPVEEALESSTEQIAEKQEKKAEQPSALSVEQIADEQVEEAVEQPVAEAVEKPAAEKFEKIIEVKEVKEPPKPAKQEVVAPAEPSVTYSIHAGSFRKTERAQKEVDRFTKAGFNAYIERVSLGDKGVWYRVKIGLYNSRAEALTAEKELLKMAKVQTRIIRNK